MANTDERIMDGLSQWVGNPDTENNMYHARQRSDLKFREAMGSGEGGGGTPPPTTGQLWPRGT